MSERCIYVYCIAGGDSLPEAVPDCEVISAGGLHAIVRETSPDEFAGLAPGADGEVPPALAELLVAHDRTVQAVFATHAVLPMRFGTAVASRGLLSAYLERSAPDLLEQLERIRGCAEWTVRWQRTAPGAPPEPAAAGEGGRGYLLRRRQELDAGRRALQAFRMLAEQAHQELLHLSVAASPGETGGESLRCAYLVERRREAEFQSRVEAWRSEFTPAGGEVRLSGPWPPYSFCCEIPANGEPVRPR